MMAISAVDNALWDLRGRYYQTPVYRLLGGPSRTQVEAYGSCLGFSVQPEAAAVRARQLKDQGFRYQKWFLAYGPGDGAEGQAKNIELVRILREAVGSQVELMFDAFMGWDLPYALRWAKAAEPYHPFWIEETFAPDRMDSFLRLSQGTTIPVATGEHFYSRWEVQPFLAASAIQVVQADPEWCGGVSELAALHTVASQSPAVCPLVEYLLRWMPHKTHFEKDPPATRNGTMTLPQRPGFGILLDEAKIEEQTVLNKV
jgi:L-alanine-DL-glutamate epimerase-like enolase superfamily enzyme